MPLSQFKNKKMPQCQCKTSRGIRCLKSASRTGDTRFCNLHQACADVASVSAPARPSTPQVGKGRQFRLRLKSAGHRRHKTMPAPRRKNSAPFIDPSLLEPASGPIFYHGACPKGAEWDPVRGECINKASEEPLAPGTVILDVSGSQVEAVVDNSGAAVALTAPVPIAQVAKDIVAQEVPDAPPDAPVLSVAPVIAVKVAPKGNLQKEITAARAGGMGTDRDFLLKQIRDRPKLKPVTVANPKSNAPKNKSALFAKLASKVAKKEVANTVKVTAPLRYHGACLEGAEWDLVKGKCITKAGKPLTPGTLLVNKDATKVEAVVTSSGDAVPLDKPVPISDIPSVPEAPPLVAPMAPALKQEIVKKRDDGDTTDRQSLLEQIRNGTKLKKTTPVERPPAIESPPSGLGAAMNNLALKDRLQLIRKQTESDDDSDANDDEWAASKRHRARKY